MAGTKSNSDYQAAFREAEYRRYMLAQIRERLLLSATEKLRESSFSLNRDIRVLSQSTKSLLKSSTRIEYLTTLVIIVGIATIAIILLSIGQPVFALVDVIAAFVGIFLLWMRFKGEKAFASAS